MKPTNESKPKRRPKLSQREAKFVKAKVEGKSNTQAALEATGATSVNSAKRMGHDLSTKLNVQEALDLALQKQGLTADAIVETVAEGMKANKTATYQGAVYDSDQPDHATRVSSAKTLAGFMGLDKQNEGGTTNYNFINVAKNDKDEFGI